MKDTFGVDIRPTDRVRVTSWGYGARSMDCGTASNVLRINRSRVVITDAQGYERAVGPGNLGVLHRGGGDGYEGNNPTPDTHRQINLNTVIDLIEEDWTLNFGVVGRDAIEQDVRTWARNLLTEALAANGVRGEAS